MDLSDDTNKRSLFDDNDTPLNSLVAPSDHDQSDSEDDFALNSMVDQDALDNYNIPSNLKNILRMDDHDINLNDSFRDDSESDDDSFINRRFEASVDINKINEEIEKNKSKFMNFPLMPPTEEEKEPKMTVKRPKKPREKKKRREKKDVFEAQREARANKLHQLLKGLREENESEEEEKENNKSKRKMGRRTRKKESNEIKVDENGERLIRTTELLDDTSEEEEDEGEERKLSKRAELEMYREAERRRRAANVMLKPVYNIKSFDDFVKRRDEHEQAYLRKLELERQHKTVSSHIPNKHEESDDSDLEIIGDPKRIAASLLSPDRVRYPIPNFSPIRHASIALREHNRRMLNRITNEGYDHRIKMEEEAKARGYFASATERAKRLLEKEKNALMIKEQVDMHFEMKKGPKNYNNSSEDEDESYEANDDVFDEFSGSEEEFDIDYVDDVKKNSLKRKVDSNDEDGDENDMATIAFRRWKGKKAKKSIFDDEDEDEDENENSSAKKKAAQKPEPAHSIVNFFKAKEAKNNEIKEANEDEREEKPLTRLVRRDSNDDTVDDTKEEMQTDDLNAMDIDEISAPVKKLQKATLSSKPEGNNEYLEEEAEEEEDEYFGVAGSDEEIGENLDEFEDDGLLVENNDEYVDEAVLREAFM
ncbi:uncharacterized protein BX663DRAFT_203905 [Cokeromyces recurvatus]|uniref:uncharacterized protein n=1 Tax=Cokeromyces recurvatus TaxID=90255 RepID=UPI00222075F6|nr:uncharacterized protein BX663DRAFT_203905 [Cokeromyces recurvatus]KAI7906739.1 hypothetical protein BX663DRAFT_203905 [Cokeromyces recurvatus]